MAGADDLDDFDGYDERPKPPAQVTILTMVLILLNVAAALGFVYLLGMTYQKRQEWSYQVFMAHLTEGGLPLSVEDEGPSASRVTQPSYRLESDNLKDAYTKRGGKPLTDPFEPAGLVTTPVFAPDKNGSHDYKDGNWVVNATRQGNYFLVVTDPSRNPRNFIRAKDLTPAILKDLFGNLGKEVKTLEEEVNRLKSEVPTEIEAAAAEIAKQAKDPKEKRELAAKLLQPIMTDVFKIEALARRVQEIQESELDALVKEAAHRRLLYEFLAPLEIAKPGDLATRLLERAADIKGLKVLEKVLEKVGGKDAVKFVEKDVEPLPLEDLVNRVTRRFEGAVSAKFLPDVHQGKDWDGQDRDSIEQRATIGLMLVAIANVRKPDGALLYPSAAERAEVVLGVSEYALAIQAYAQAWQKLEDRLVDALQVDRRGFEVAIKGGGVGRNQSFLDRHRADILRIQDLAERISQTNGRLKIAQEHNANAKKLYEERVAHQTTVTAKLVEARAETARLVEEARELQRQMFQAQLELAEAAEINFNLERRIIAEEKGAKAP